MSNDLTASSQLFGAYLHQDWTEEFGSDAEAITAIREGETEEIRTAAVKELRQLLASPIDENELRSVVMHQLGCYFDPSSKGLSYREWLAAATTQLEAA